MELSVFNALHGLVGQSGLLDWLIIFFGKYLSYFLVIAALWFLFRQKDWKKRFYIFAFSALAIILSRGIITEVIRFFYFRPRPFAALNFEPLIDHAATAAFPSGHAASYFALAFAIFVFNKKWGTVFIVAASLMGLARVIAGAHWPLDVVAGALVALVSVFVVKWLLPARS